MGMSQYSKFHEKVIFMRNNSSDNRVLPCRLITCAGLRSLRMPLSSLLKRKWLFKQKYRIITCFFVLKWYLLLPKLKILSVGIDLWGNATVKREKSPERKEPHPPLFFFLTRFSPLLSGIPIFLHVKSVRVAVFC